ncbi:MAG: UDP-2,4-diacetamido-2,4,6-trideoxy-beta-L-altropyranose hydrolase [Nitrospiraceae bacterium]|nr:UDP-2,4-diacetamido-2,4,6-trideoxy-beta-L-altropyranose hydrolase [Nitrospiraceae bacterium]
MRLVIRADATAQMGTGHLMRCLALGQAWKDRGGEAVFVSYEESKNLLEKIKREFRVYRLSNAETETAMSKILTEENPDWVALDGYHFDGECQKAVKMAGPRLLYIDDYAPLEHYYADIILNQNFGAEELKYAAEPYTRTLAGTRYALLRREFLKYSGFRRETPDIAAKILVTMGGADAENFTLKILRALGLIDEPLQVKIIIGASNPHCESIVKEAGKAGHAAEILKSVENMAPLMAWADLAVSAGGSTIWELAFMGLPALIGIVAENQEKSVNLLREDGIYPSCGWIKDKTAKELAGMIEALIKDKDLRLEMSKRARRMVDGKGADRVIDRLAWRCF